MLLTAEALHARGQIVGEAARLQILRIGWQPRVLAWVLRIVRAGATRAERLTEVTPFAARSGPLEVPGRRCRCRPPGTPAGTAPSTCPAAACSSPVMP